MIREEPNGKKLKVIDDNSLAFLPQDMKKGDGWITVQISYHFNALLIASSKHYCGCYLVDRMSHERLARKTVFHSKSHFFDQFHKLINLSCRRKALAVYYIFKVIGTCQSGESVKFFFSGIFSKATQKNERKKNTCVTWNEQNRGVCHQKCELM